MIYLAVGRGPSPLFGTAKLGTKCTFEYFRHSRCISVNNGKKKRLPPEDESLCVILPTIFPSPE